MAGIGGGLNLRAAQPHVRLRPWQPAVDLEDSALVGSDVRLPTPCGEHAVFYPSLLVSEAMRGNFSSFVARCECDKAYLVTTESDGAHFKAEGSATRSAD